MISKSVGILALIAFGAATAGCQSPFAEPEENSVGALRLAEAPDVPSAQRVDEDGYPLLGAFPGAAAKQLTDDEVSADRSHFNSIAQSRFAASPPSGYGRAVARAQRVRQDQARAVAGAISANPPPRPAKLQRRSPDEVLRQIEAEGAALR